jgi:uncharacterized membrane protein
MPTWFRKLWDALRASYWFVPLVMALGAALLALAAVNIDRTLRGENWWTYGGGPEGARAVLSALAGSMITVAGVVFSITIVALSLASSQFGPRLLRNFIRDRRSQFALGSFTSTFIYCLLVLRTVRGTEDQHFVPELAVAIGIFLGVASIVVLMYYIHHVAVSIQVDEVIRRVTGELLDTIDRLWPDEIGKEKPTVEGATGDPAGVRALVVSDRGGFVESVDSDALMEVARRHNVVVYLQVRPGEFVIEGESLAEVSGHAELSNETLTKLRACITVADQRTGFQDALFTADQLVEVAVRALSPGINDPFTAETCIDRLGQALSRLARRSLPDAQRFDSEGRLRVVARIVTLVEMIDATFDRLRTHARDNVSVVVRAMIALGRIGKSASRSSDRECVRRHLDLFLRAGLRELNEEVDRSTVEDRHRDAVSCLPSQ